MNLSILQRRLLIVYTIAYSTTNIYIYMYVILQEAQNQSPVNKELRKEDVKDFQEIDSEYASDASNGPQVRDETAAGQTCIVINSIISPVYLF